MDWDKQKALKELGIPETFYDELVRGFADQSQGAMQDLEKAVQQQDFDGVVRAAHFIKGAAGNLRIEELYLVSRELEAAARSDRDLRMIEQRKETLQRLMEELKKRIQHA